jgi:multiple sugar transport system substrate-binding protein
VVASISVLGWDHPRCTNPLTAAGKAWEKRTGDPIQLAFRTLEQFGDQPIADAIGACDVVFFDHPHVAQAAQDGALLPLDDLLPAEILERHATDAVGPSHRSYGYAGRQWGLAADAACQVMAYRADRVEAPPATWGEVLDYSQRNPGAVALPMHPTQLLCAYLTLCGSHGGDWREQAAGVPAVEFLRAVRSAAGHTWSDPPAVLHELTRRDGTLAVVPIVFGYVTYAVDGADIEAPCTFCDLPSAGRGPAGSLLGGVGLGISAAARRPRAGAEFASWFCSVEVQRTIVTPAGGQPAAHACWTDPGVNRSWNGFYQGTLATMEASAIRPRHPNWPGFQPVAGQYLTAALASDRSAAAVVDGLASLATEHGLQRRPPASSVDSDD